MYLSFMSWWYLSAVPVILFVFGTIMVIGVIIIFAGFGCELYNVIFAKKIHIIYTDSNKDTICFYKSSDPPENILSYKTFAVSEEVMAILYAKKFATKNNLKFEHKYKEN